MKSRREIESIAAEIVDAAIDVPRKLGPGLLESAYQKCHSYALTQRGLSVDREMVLPIRFDGIQIDAGYRLDALVEGCVVVEHKTVETLLPIHEAQLLTYLRLTGCRLGFLLNWHVPLLKHGIKRMVLGLEEATNPKRPQRIRASLRPSRLRGVD